MDNSGYKEVVFNGRVYQVQPHVVEDIKRLLAPFKNDSHPVESAEDLHKAAPKVHDTPAKAEVSNPGPKPMPEGHPLTNDPTGPAQPETTEPAEPTPLNPDQPGDPAPDGENPTTESGTEEGQPQGDTEGESDPNANNAQPGGGTT